MHLDELCRNPGRRRAGFFAMEGTASSALICENELNPSQLGGTNPTKTVVTNEPNSTRAVNEFAKRTQAGSFSGQLRFANVAGSTRAGCSFDELGARIAGLAKRTQSVHSKSRFPVISLICPVILP